MVSSFEQYQQCRVDGTCPGRSHHRCNSTFQRRQTLFQNVVGRIVDTGVNVAKFCQREKIGRMIGIVEYECRALVNGHCPGSTIDGYNHVRHARHWLKIFDHS